MKISKIIHRITTSTFILFYFTFLSTLLPAAELGINSSIECDPPLAHHTANIKHLSFVVVDDALRIGTLQRYYDSIDTSIRTKYVASDGRLTNQGAPCNFTWLNPNASLITPYFTSDSFFVKNLGFDLKDSPINIKPKILSLAQIFTAGFQNPKDAVESIKNTFSKSDTEAQHILNNSTQKIRCSLEPVMLTNLDSTPIQIDEGRYHLKIEADTLKSWVDTEATLTVAAPGYGVVILEKSCWPVDTNSANQIVKNELQLFDEDVSVPCGGPLTIVYAVLSLIGNNKSCAASNTTHFSFGSRHDSDDTAARSSTGYTFAKLGTQPEFTPLTQQEKENVTREVPAELSNRYKISFEEAWAFQDINSITDRSSEVIDLQSFINEILAIRAPRKPLFKDLIDEISATLNPLHKALEAAQIEDPENKVLNKIMKSENNSEEYH